MMQKSVDRRVVGAAPGNDDGAGLPVIVISVNSGRDAIGAVYAAIDAQDGEVLAGHFSTNDRWAWFDLGGSPESRRKHDIYCRKYPSGFVLEWAYYGSAERERVLALNRAYVAGKSGPESPT